MLWHSLASCADFSPCFANNVDQMNLDIKVFAQAAKQISPPTSRHLPGLAPFVVLNDTGILVKVANSEDIRVRYIMQRFKSKLVQSTNGQTTRAFAGLSLSSSTTRGNTTRLPLTDNTLAHIEN